MLVFNPENGAFSKIKKSDTQSETDRQSDFDPSPTITMKAANSLKTTRFIVHAILTFLKYTIHAPTIHYTNSISISISIGISISISISISIRVTVPQNQTKNDSHI